MRGRDGLVAVVATLVLALTACGGGDAEPETEAESSPASSPSSPASTPSSPTPEPSPTRKAQPKGKYGVTYRILNWRTYADDPAVLAWKRAFEAGAGSANRGKMVPALVDLAAKDARRALVASAQQAWSNNWHVKKVGKARVRSARTAGRRSSLVLCTWAPSTSFFQENGDWVGEPEVEWSRQEATLRKRKGAWQLVAFDFDGTCKGGAPK